MLHEGRLRWIKSCIAQNAIFFDRYTHSDAPAAMAVKFLLELIPEVERLRTSRHDALMQVRQESYVARAYMNEARDWIKTILEEAEASPRTREEWRDSLCRGSIEGVITKCKAALSELPEGGEVVFEVRQKLADADGAQRCEDCGAPWADCLSGLCACCEARRDHVAL